MLTPIIIIVSVIVLVVVAIIIFKKKPVPPVPSPSNLPNPSPSPTPIPPGNTEIEVLNAEPNSRNISSIRVDGRIVEGEFPLLPGNVRTYSTDQSGILDVQVRFNGLPAGTESVALYCGAYQDCVTAPASTHDFTNVSIDGTRISIDYGEVGC